jgi:hypothetical protein
MAQNPIGGRAESLLPFFILVTDFECFLDGEADGTE